ncbi:MULTISPECIES: hypothetical protein [unclassified Moorena]|nr:MULTISPECIES: hypothetical protein [unclassified Moorena]NEO20623.1 hypothetical protein [Moorena sp. SIO4A5]NEQ58596.1 hypothetical protein [Moorena sp. SIO4A1]
MDLRDFRPGLMGVGSREWGVGVSNLMGSQGIGLKHCPPYMNYCSDWP